MSELIRRIFNYVVRRQVFVCVRNLWLALSNYDTHPKSYLQAASPKTHRINHQCDWEPASWFHAYVQSAAADMGLSALPAGRHDGRVGGRMYRLRVFQSSGWLKGAVQDGQLEVGMITRPILELVSAGQSKQRLGAPQLHLDRSKLSCGWQEGPYTGSYRVRYMGKCGLNGVRFDQLAGVHPKRWPGGGGRAPTLEA